MSSTPTFNMNPNEEEKQFEEELQGGFETPKHSSPEVNKQNEAM